MARKTNKEVIDNILRNVPVHSMLRTDVTDAFHLSPLDSRYAADLQPVTSIFCNFARVKLMVAIETLYFLEIYGEILNLKSGALEVRDKVVSRVETFSVEDYREVMILEKGTRHDVKAVEMWVRSMLINHGVTKSDAEYVHIGLTSQDVISMVNSIMLSSFIQILNDSMFGIKMRMGDATQMIARTHGQPAVLTTMEREMCVFTYRCSKILIKGGLLNPLDCKFSGAIGDLSVFKHISHEMNWDSFMDDFVESMGLKRSNSEWVTQVDNNISLVKAFDSMRGISNILIDLCRDVWYYISIGYFKLPVVEGQAGSSTMPQKVNPIMFENAEGNLEMAVMWFTMFSNKLQISRLQRDLTDSTVMRNIGVACGHLHLAINYIKRGLHALRLDEDKMRDDISNNCQIFAETVQIMLRVNGSIGAYDLIKSKFMGISNMSIVEFVVLIKELDIEQALKIDILNNTIYKISQPVIEYNQS